MPAPADGRVLIAPDRTWLATEPTLPCGLIVYADHRPGAPLTLDPVPEQRAPFRLLEATRDVVLPGDPPFAPVEALGRRAPALSLTYGDYGQLPASSIFWCARWWRARPSRPTWSASSPGSRSRRLPPRRYHDGQPRFPIPAATERKLKCKLTIGMATYDDYDGVYFSVQALRMYHPEILDQVEILVVDNHPDGPTSAALKALGERRAELSLRPGQRDSGTAIRDRVFAEAGGDFVAVHGLPRVRRARARFAASSTTSPPIPQAATWCKGR